MAVAEYVMQAALTRLLLEIKDLRQSNPVVAPKLLSAL